MRTTIIINDKLYNELKHRAVDSGTTVSAYIEDAIKYQILEDVEDLETIRAREHEATHSFDDLVKEFKAEGLL